MSNNVRWHSFITAATSHPCLVCGESSPYLHVDFEAYMHPECELTAWKMYQDALSSAFDSYPPEDSFPGVEV